MGVYVFGEPGMLLVKVGYTINPRERERALQRQFGDERRFLYFHRHANELDERRAHRLLRARFWLESEWFMCGVEPAKYAIRRVHRVAYLAVMQARSSRRVLAIARKIRRKRRLEAAA